ncbi:uncharacterized protein LOC111334887 [Stylophora pistillata]|nr:uncharacterized protein LOC111334887 [Stylophora pistillata]
MGNAEAVPHEKRMSSTKPGNVFSPVDGKLTTDGRYGTSSQTTTEADREIETTENLEETTPRGKTDITNADDPKLPFSNSVPFTNSSASGGTQQQRRVWQEVALRYQQILHREYRMMNLPSYPVQGGNVYLYYVPVMVDHGSATQTPSFNSEHRSTEAAARESRKEKDDIIYIHDSDDEIHSDVKEELSELVKSCSFRKPARAESPREATSPIFEKKNQVEKYSLIKLEDPVLKPKERVNQSEYNHLSESSSDGRDDPKTIMDNQNSEYYDEYDQVTEDHIRIFKGYTIEYHPVYRDKLMKDQKNSRRSEQYTERDEKILDLKKRLAEHTIELEKLKQQQSVKEGVPSNGRLDGIYQQNNKDRSTDGEIIEYSKSSGDQEERVCPKDCPSTQIHYFPSGERKTTLQRKNCRKQTSPRRIDSPFNVNTKEKAGDVGAVPTESAVKNFVLKRKFNLPSGVLQEQSSDDKKNKRTQCSKKTKIRRKRKRGQRMSSSSKLKGIRSMNDKGQEELGPVTNLDRACAPEDISQEEFLSLFGLLKMNQKQS